MCKWLEMRGQRVGSKMLGCQGFAGMADGGRRWAPMESVDRRETRGVS